MKLITNIKYVLFVASHKYTLKLSPRICAFFLASPIPSQKSKQTRHKSHNDTLHARTEFPTCGIVGPESLSMTWTNKWFSIYRDFLLEKDLLDKPERIWNADECGFTMGSKAGKVIGPVQRKGSFQVPHVTGSSNKERLTTMFSASAAGIIMPPFLVYPRPKPTGCNQLNGALQGTVSEYITKGWMDLLTFVKFINDFDQHAGPQRPVLLLIDSVSSHVDMEAFPTVASKGIELYRLIPNATHHTLLQPLDKGVSGALKTKWS